MRCSTRWQRAGIDPAEVEDVIMGSTFGEGTTGGNIARAIALRAGLPVSTAGLSINRFCSSGLQSIALAAQRIMTEGAERDRRRRPREHFLRAERSQHAHARDPWILEHKPTLYWSMLQTAETVAKRYTFRSRRRTSTACAASCVRPRAQPPASSRTRSCR
jgi:acetyl-CoA C-acetyltransferase